MLTPRVPVAKEGYPFIGITAFCAVLLACLGYPAATLIFFLATVFTVSFFRDPERFVPDHPNGLVSPADGKVILVENVDDNQFTGGQAIKISIFMNVFNAHINRAPVDGTVSTISYKPGKFYSADSKRGGLENEYCATVVQTPTGAKLAFVQIAGLIARRIVCWLEIGDSITRGMRIGLIRFGSRVDLYLPPNTDIQVRVGEQVRAGETVIGTLADTDS